MKATLACGLIEGNEIGADDGSRVGRNGGRDFVEKDGYGLGSESGGRMLGDGVYIAFGC